jgi:hypothetical protein
MRPAFAMNFLLFTSGSLNGFIPFIFNQSCWTSLPIMHKNNYAPIHLDKPTGRISLHTSILLHC